jgi:hypothetical protein
MMIYRCSDGHISFSRDLRYCGMKGCSKSVDVISEKDVEWFYKISPDGLAIPEKDLHMIIEDRNMPKDVKKEIREIFPYLKKSWWSRI